MKKLIGILLFFVATQAFAVDISRLKDGFITVDTLTNTTGLAYENYTIIQLHPNVHKVVAIFPNGRYLTEFCNQVDKNADTQCATYDPEPIFADWDAAQAANNITIAGVLTNTQINKNTAHWFYQAYVANDLNGLYNELVANLTLTDAERRNRYFGSCRAYEFDDTTCASFVTIRFDTGRRPRAGEMTLTKVPGRFKKMIDEMRRLVIE